MRWMEACFDFNVSFTSNLFETLGGNVYEQTAAQSLSFVQKAFGASFIQHTIFICFKMEMSRGTFGLSYIGKLHRLLGLGYTR
jgi:hypothetical protein